MLVPLTDGGKVDVERRSVTREEGDVTFTLAGSAWKGEPAWLEEVVTPVYAIVENRGTIPITIGYGDLVILDAERVQYPALSPETVASRVRSLGRSYAPGPPSGFYVGGFGWRSYWGSPFWPWWYEPWPILPNVSEIFSQALPVGSVRPNARFQGFIYFTHLPKAASRVTISIGYERSGEAGRREVSFPFVIQEKN